MHTLFLLNPTAGKSDCTRALPQQIDAAAARAGLATGEYTIRTTAHAGHARVQSDLPAVGFKRNKVCMNFLLQFCFFRYTLIL